MVLFECAFFVEMSLIFNGKALHHPNRIYKNALHRTATEITEDVTIGVRNSLREIPAWLNVTWFQATTIFFLVEFRN